MKPNLLFIMTDQQKATSLDLYNPSGSAAETRALRGLAEEGTVFENASCPYPLCVPSRISMLTGIYPSASGFVGNGPYIEDRYETVFGAAKQRGYRTMLVGKDHAYTKAAIGGDPGMHPAFMDTIFDSMYCAMHNTYQPPEIERDLPHVRPWLNETSVLHRIWGSEVAPWTSRQSISARLCDVAMENLDRWDAEDRPDDIPFALWLSFPDPHELYQAPADVYESIDPTSIALPPNWESDIANRAEYIRFMHWYFNAGGVPEEEVLKLVRVYLAMCKNVDMQLERLFAFLRRRGLWENTVVVYTSDHGDFNGEHQLIQKFNAGYDGCCRVPLMIAQPGASQSRRYAGPVSLTDIPSTLCDLLGWDRFAADQGCSLAETVLSGAPRAVNYTVTESGLYGESLTTRDIANFPNHRYDRRPVGRWSYDPPHRFGGKLYAVRSADYKMIVRQDQKTELYDMVADPWETRNIAEERGFEQTVRQHYGLLTDHLMRISQKQPDTRIASQDDWYRAGGNKAWEEVVPESVKAKQREQ